MFRITPPVPPGLVFQAASQTHAKMWKDGLTEYISVWPKIPCALFQLLPKSIHLLINLGAGIRYINFFRLRQRGLAQRGLQKVPDSVINLIVSAK